MSTKPAAVKQEQEELQPSPSSSSVLCDMCLDSQTPALKTCLKCEISMCAQHLQAHLTTPVLLQTHPLTKPMPAGGLSSGAVARCPEHGKLLEYYCLDDRLCVCVSCSIEDQHRVHNLKTLAGAQKVLVEKLKEEKKELAEREVQGKALKSWETKQKKDLEVSIEHLQNAVVALRDIGLTKVGSSVSRRLDAIQSAQRSIETALSEEDAYLFLQGFGDVYEAVQKAQAVDFIHGLEETAKPEQVVFDLLKNGHETVQKVLKLQRDLLTLVDPNKQFWGTDNPTDMIIDKNTIGQHFLVSTDLKTLSCCSPTAKISQRVYFKNTTDSDLHWTTVVLSDEYNWSVGLCGTGLPSTVSSEGTLRSPLYGLEWRNKQLFALESHLLAPDQPFNLSSEVIKYPRKTSSTPEGMVFDNEVEVWWDNNSKSLSFFTRGEYGQRIFLHRADIESSLSQKLSAFVTLEKEQKDTSTRSPPVHIRFPQNVQPTNHADIVCSVKDLKND